MNLSVQKKSTSSLLPSTYSASTDGWANGLSADTSFANPKAVEDRFIGIVDYKEFLHNPPDMCAHAAGSVAEARYRKTLESRMGLGGSGLMLFHAGDLAPNFPRLDLNGGDYYPFSAGCAYRGDGITTMDGQLQLPSFNADLMTEVAQEPNDGFCTPPSTPIKNSIEGVQISFPSSQRTASTFSSPKPTFTAHVQLNNGCHTPLAVSKNWGMGNQETRSSGMNGGFISGSPYSYSQRCDTHRTTPVLSTNGFPSPLRGSRSGDVVSTLATSPHPGRNATLHSCASPQLRTPVRHENDLLCTPTQGGHGGNITVSQGASPVSRRSVLYSQHATPRRQGETCDRVLSAEGLSVCDGQGRPNFTPLSWGHMGVVVALQRSVYLWQESGKTYFLFETPTAATLVSAVASSMRPTEMGDVFLAVGMNNGFITVLKYYVGGGDSIGCDASQFTPTGILLEKTTQSSFMGTFSHVSTLYLVGHFLFSGCMDGILTVRNLRDGSVIWHSSGAFAQIDLSSYASRLADYSVDVGAPIYKIEATPDGEHIAVGTNDSLFVYQTNCMGPENRTRRRVVFSGAPRPVRAFCWWSFPFSSSNGRAVDAHHGSGGGSRFDFLHTVLLYGGGSDGSVLSVYFVGSRCHKTKYRMSAPILGIVSSEASEEIFVSLDIAGGEVENVSNAEEIGVPPVVDGNVHRVADNITVGGFGGPDDWASSGSSSEEEGLPHAPSVGQHLPIGVSGRGGHNRMNGNGAGGMTLGLSPALARRFIHRMEATRARPPLPHMTLFRESTQGAGLLQLFQLKDGGARLERLSGFVGPHIASLYMALSPDNSLLATAGSEMKLRIWRAFKLKSPVSGVRCELR
ncbi:hypothetical protein TCDM_01601 [Trypanosoma cruzi Dm28c]|uniref:Guanine nucleotide-binding protein subunit beta-like protein n=1 Tax=Trypanosoma cruzi Dm28c TaxID=1416333 RepID=V5BYL6_TRYCR|nr:hypothetical protein TCDM_01601 [Trypanosoma cruzi Dm28c]